MIELQHAQLPNLAQWHSCGIGAWVAIVFANACKSANAIPVPPHEGEAIFFRIGIPSVHCEGGELPCPHAELRAKRA